MITIIGLWAHADTEAEISGGTYPENCIIFAKDTQVTYTYDSGHSPALYVSKPSSQSELESGSNIKTVNGVSLLGSGNITVSGGGSSNGYFPQGW